MKRAAVFMALAGLTGCGESKAPEPAPEPTATAASVQTPQAAAAIDGKVTPNKDRIATLGLLNKRNNLTQDLVLKVGESRRVGNVLVRLQSCERTAPWELPQETGAFVQVLVREPPAPRADPQWRGVFSGWLFKNSPALNVVEHPVYDVWVKDCAMNFPNDGESSSDSADADNSAKASGSERGASASE